MKTFSLLKDLLGPDFRPHPVRVRPMIRQAVGVDSASRSWETLELKEITDDSRKVTEGGVFFAYRGGISDGHDHLDEAVRCKPAALCVEDISRVPTEYEGLVFEAERGRRVFAQLVYRFAGSPADGSLNVGITGTNGKTTVAHMIEHVFNAAGMPTGVIGTVDHHFRDAHWETRLTTPGAPELTERLRDFARLGAKALAMEVSSHALSQHRADGIPFNIGVFTNLTRDHLDFHRDMEDYFRSKARLFAELIPAGRHPRGAVVNVEDEYGARLAEMLDIPVLRYGGEGADLVYEVIEESFGGTRAKVSVSGAADLLELRIPCRHNLQNALAALGSALTAGIPREKIFEALASFTGVKGRLEAVANPKGVHVFIDYAHTDHALRSVLSSLKEIRDRRSAESRVARAKIITVFGCGGDRDKGKRPLMFAAAREFSDVVIVTSDNPRGEDPEVILDDILRNVKKDETSAVFREADRKRAIALALTRAEAGDVVLVAGKGHEEYQILGDRRLPFSDRDTVKEFFA